MAFSALECQHIKVIRSLDEIKRGSARSLPFLSALQSKRFIREIFENASKSNELDEDDGDERLTGVRASKNSIRTIFERINLFLTKIYVVSVV